MKRRNPQVLLEMRDFQRQAHNELAELMGSDGAEFEPYVLEKAMLACGSVVQAIEAAARRAAISSNVSVRPSFGIHADRDDDNYISQIKVFVGSPSLNLYFTVWPNRVIPDDVLEYGDTDFFGKDPVADADYFSLVQALQSATDTKPITFYTARPVADRSLYLSTMSVPSGIFLTRSPDRAAGLAIDLGGRRDVWRVKMLPRYVIVTLDAGRDSEYQVIPTASGMAPVESLTLWSEG